MNEPPANGQMIKTVVVLGPTAAGKTRLGVTLARRFGGEILSVDSRQVYRGMDIGTGKDLHEYGEGDNRVPYHLVDLVDPRQDFNLFRYVEFFRNALDQVCRRGRLPIMVGGSPLYLKAVLENYELPGAAADPDFRRRLENCSDQTLINQLRRQAPELFARTDLTQRRRVVRALEIARTQYGGRELRNVLFVGPESVRPMRIEPGRDRFPTYNRLDSHFSQFSEYGAAGSTQPPTGAARGGALLQPLLIAPWLDRKEVHRRIEARLDQRLQQGLLEEVRRLRESGVSWQRLEVFGLEYRCAGQLLQGRIGNQEFRQQLLARIRRFARGQDGWFRKFERDGWQIHWLPGGDPEAAVELVDLFLRNQPLPPPRFRLEDIRYGPRSHPSNSNSISNQ